MFKILGKLPWFEWVGIFAVCIAVGMGYTLVKTYTTTVENNVVLETHNTELTEQLNREKQVSVITDEVLFKFNFERELKIKEASGYTATTLEEYFNTRDSYVPSTDSAQKEIVDVPASVSKTTTPKPVVLDTAPNAAAINVLVNGMRRTYCRAYHDRDTCPTEDTTH